MIVSNLGIGVSRTIALRDTAVPHMLGSVIVKPGPFLHRRRAILLEKRGEL
jgi:hypothetical protein